VGIGNQSGLDHRYPSKRIFLIVKSATMKTHVGSMLLAIILPQSAAGKVGETLDQCIARYGLEQSLERTDNALFKGSKLHAFSSNGFRVVVEILDGKSVAATLGREKSLLAKTRPPMSKGLIDKLLKANGDGVGWKRVATSPTVMQWMRDDGAVAATYEPDHHLAFYATNVDQSIIETTASTIAPEPAVDARNTAAIAPGASFVTLPETLTIGGQTYEKPVYQSHNAYLLTFNHATGIATARIANLSAAIQQQLGFDRAAAEVAEKAYLEQQVAAKLAESQAREAETPDQVADIAPNQTKNSAPESASAQASQGRLDLSHRSLNGGAALTPDAIAANLFDLKGQIVRVAFKTPDSTHRAVRQTPDGFYELNVLPLGCNAVVRIPVDVGRKWFAPRNNKYYPQRLVVRVDVGEIENEYGTVRDGAILVAIGTKIRSGMGSEGSWVEW
jgi:hypothetical protein